MNTTESLALTLATQDVLLGLVPADKDDAVALLAEHAARRLGIDAALIRFTLMRREDLGSSGIGGGVALPHGSLDGLRTPFAALVILKEPVDFGAADNQPVDVIFLLLTPAGKSGKYLPIMSAFARQCRGDGVLTRMRAAETQATARIILIGQEASDPP